MKADIDLDSIVNYQAEYASRIDKAKVTGGRLTGLCPFHDDSNPSFSVDLTTGQWQCFACGKKGNYISFRAELDHVDNAEARKTILQEYGVQPSRNNGKRQKKEPYTLAQYSREKAIPESFLRQQFLLSDWVDYDRISGVAMPYMLEDWTPGNSTKVRFAHKLFTWRHTDKAAGKQILLYGLWRLPEFRTQGKVILVEGESDTQSLWYMGFPALGVPGATNISAERAQPLQGLQVYVHVEPDAGGQTFLRGVRKALRDMGFTGQASSWTCGGIALRKAENGSEGRCKDPSDVLIAYGPEEGKRLLLEAMQKAEPLEALPAAESRSEQKGTPGVPPGQWVLTDAPIALTPPAGWSITDDGIFQLGKNEEATLVCRAPLLITRRLQNIDTEEEKLELSFRRDGRWREAVLPRSTVFSARNIICLSDLGCTITSENARGVVRYLGRLEEENFDSIPRTDSVSVYGWHRAGGEWRFVPGIAEGLALDVDPNQRAIAEGYSTAGSLDAWIKTVAPHRQREIFRFILAAGFAAPLLRITGQRIFIVYNWGGSRGGKTAALKAALSVWGDPERLMVNFNATQVGLERTAAFFRDLPLGIDERQLAGDNQGTLEKLVYMISSGKGRTRGSKTGGLQATQQWRTVALATGEEPLSADTSKTGVSTRVLEVYGAPFEDEEAAAAMHNAAGENYGWAGPEFVRRALVLGEQEIRRRFEEYRAFVQKQSDGKNGSHVAGVALVALADSLASQWFFGVAQDAAEQQARTMAADLLTTQIEANSTDVNEAAAQYIADMIYRKKAAFSSEALDRYGYIDEAAGIAYINPAVLTDTLLGAGFNPLKTRRYLLEQNLILPGTDRHHPFTVVRGSGVNSARYLAFRMEAVEAMFGGGSERNAALPEADGDQADFHLSDGPVSSEWEGLPF